MKKFAFITGAIAFSLGSMGWLFKINHWSGGDLMLVGGIGMFSLFFTPTIFKYMYDLK
jgi:hypothetical protein